MTDDDIATTDEDIAEGWYNDAYGKVRWWDGTQWTEHVRDRQPRTHGGPSRGSSRHLAPSHRVE